MNIEKVIDDIETAIVDVLVKANSGSTSLSPRDTASAIFAGAIGVIRDMCAEEKDIYRAILRAFSTALLKIANRGEN